MRRACRLAGVGLAMALLGGCGGPGPPPPAPTAAGVVAPEVLAKASLEYYWQYPVRFLAAGETVERIWRLDENLYGLTSRNRLIALDAANGTFKWELTVAEAGRKVFAPCHADEVKLAKFGGIRLVTHPPDPEDKEKVTTVNGVVINTTSYALLLERQTGQTLRKLDFKFAANSPGSSDGIYFFVGSSRGWYYAVRLVDALTPWTMGTDDMITARPAAYGGRLYVASRDGRFYAVNPYLPKDRHLWTRKTAGPLTADFTVDSRGCFVGGEDFNLYAYDVVEGDTLWVFRAQGSLREPVQVGARTIYQRADQDRFYALDLATGRKRWELPDGHSVLGTIGSHVYVLTFERKLRVIHEALGREKMTLPMTGLDLFVRNAVKPVIYAATREGKFVCIRAASAGHLAPDMLKDKPGK